MTIGSSHFSDLFKLNEAAGTLEVYSDNNRRHLGIHIFAIRAWFDDYPSYIGRHEFRVNVDDSACKYSKITTSGLLDANGNPTESNVQVDIDRGYQVLKVSFRTEIDGCPLTDLKITTNKPLNPRVI